MKLTEVHELLTYVAAIDNRRFGDETVIAWHGILAELELPDCLEAARRHFGQEDAYLKPVHIVRGAEEIRRDRLRRARIEAEQRQALERAPTTAPGERAAEVEALIQELRETLPSVDERKVRRTEVLEWDRARERLARAEPNPHYQPPELEATPTDPAA